MFEKLLTVVGCIVIWGLQLANAVALLFVVQDWLGLTPTGFWGYVGSGLAFAAVLMFCSIVPFSTIIMSIVIFYYLHWVWDWGILLSLLVASPGLLIVLVGLIENLLASGFLLRMRRW